MKALIINVNRCRPDFLGCYGCDWLETPAFDQLASESVVFDQHFADCPRPRAARRTWQWGDYGFRQNAARHPGLQYLLWNRGVKTCLIGDERSPTLGSGFASGWQTSHWVRAGDLDALEQEHRLGGSIQVAVDWLGEHGKADNWLLWLELSSLQLPWDEPEAAPDKDEEDVARMGFSPMVGPLEEGSGTLESLQDAYGRMMRGTDDWLGQLLRLLRDKGLYDDLLIVVTSDCGLSLGDHGYVGDYRPWLHEELTHIPFLLRLPHGAEAGRRVQQFTQPVDLFPTLAGAFGLNLDELIGPAENVARPGRSLLPAARGEPVKLREFAVASNRRKRCAEWSIRTHEWHLLLPVGDSCTAPTSGGVGGTRERQLYVKPDDRWEVNNVAQQHRDVADDLELTLRRFMSETRS